MATDQKISVADGLAGAEDLLREEINRRRGSASASKFLRYAAMACYIGAEHSSLGFKVTIETIKSLRSAEADALMMYDYYNEFESTYQAARVNVSKRVKEYSDAIMHLVQKNTHSLSDWTKDVVISEGIAREVVIDEMCIKSMELSNSALLAAKIVELELGDEGYVIVEMLKQLVKHVSDAFHRSIEGFEPDAYIHIDNPEMRLKYCAKRRIIPEPMIKLMLAEEMAREAGEEIWTDDG